MKKVKRVIRDKETSQEPQYPVLKKLKLPLNTEVRFRLKQGKWIQGTIKGDNPDKSITIWAQGMMRSIMPENIQVKVKGPRGGTIWKDLIK